jgi:hypothetical protein
VDEGAEIAVGATTQQHKRRTKRFVATVCLGRRPATGQASIEGKFFMSSSSKRQQTVAKRNRELAVKERRVLKQQKKEARKQAAAAERDGNAPDTLTAETVEDDTAATEL